MAREITIAEGIRRVLQGEKGIKLLVSRPIGPEVTIGELAEMQSCGAVCILENEDPVQGGPRKKRIDRGKVRALHEAGWSNVKIAEEIGCSESSISMILSKEEEHNADKSDI